MTANKEQHLLYFPASSPKARGFIVFEHRSWFTAESSVLTAAAE